jgi:hypothetical protein
MGDYIQEFRTICTCIPLTGLPALFSYLPSLIEAKENMYMARDWNHYVQVVVNVEQVVVTEVHH